MRSKRAKQESSLPHKARSVKRGDRRATAQGFDGFASDRGHATGTRDGADDMPDTGKPNTRDIILDAAEKLFSEEGIGGTSIRTIIAAAAVNSAAVHYHFGSKEQLITDVFHRRASLITGERLKLLESIPADITPAAKLEAIVRAFLKPGLFGADQSKLFAQRYAVFRARLVTENSTLARDLMAHGFDESCRRFLTALGEVAPRFSIQDLHWRMHAMLGLLVYTMNRSNRIVSITRGACDPSDDNIVLEELVKITVDIFRPGLASRKITSNRARKRGLRS